MIEIEKYINLTRGYIQQPTIQENNCNTCRYDVKHTFDWTKKIKTSTFNENLVEIRFKNGRKGIYKNEDEIFLRTGDLVAVAAKTGHDIGIVGLQGEIVIWQLAKYDQNINSTFLKIYRKARENDLKNWHEAIEKEKVVFLRAKEIIKSINLEMKLTDVEFQGDGSKAIFYYIADNRVDFRELIKLLASEFRVKIEMRQIGARQEASKVGGLGTCGREFCCSSWKNEFETVSTNSARHQELSLNQTKLAGQCGKLKCCINYELDVYLEVKNSFPDTQIPLVTKKGAAYFQKSDVFRKIFWYSFHQQNSVDVTPLSIERVNEIIKMNAEDKIPETLTADNIELADLINSKHNVQITTQEIEDSNVKSDLVFKKKYKNKNKKKNKYNTRTNSSNAKQNKQNRNIKSKQNSRERQAKREQNNENKSQKYELNSHTKNNKNKKSTQNSKITNKISSYKKSQSSNSMDRH